MARGCAAKNYNIEMYEEQINEYFESPRSLRRQFKEKAASGLGRTIGSAARAAKRVIPFDPNAVDGDGDFKVQDDSIWERPAIPGLASGTGNTFSKKPPRLLDDLMEKDFNGESPKPGQIEAAELIDAAIFEQFHIALLRISPKQAEATRELVDSYEAKAGKKKPSTIFIIKDSLQKYNIEFDTDFDIESIIAGLIDENPEYEQFDDKIRGHFFATDKTKRSAALKTHKSKQYKYGDKSALGGEIRATRSDWLDELEPWQIAALVVPQSDDEKFEMYLDITFGKDADLIRNNEDVFKLEKSNFDRSNRIMLLNSIRDKNGEPRPIGISTITDDKSVEEFRKELADILTDRPEFLSVVRKIGIPYVSLFKLNDDSDEQVADAIAKTAGSYNPNISSMNFTLDKFETLKSRLIKRKSFENEVINGRPVNILHDRNSITNATLEKTITHEWGHYLQHMARRLFRKENGVSNASIVGTKTGFSKYDAVFQKLLDISLSLTFEGRINSPGAGVLVIRDKNLLDSVNSKRKILMDNAKEFSELLSNLRQLLNNNEVDINKARMMFQEIMNNAKSGGIISAPTKYGASSPEEQFAELCSFFFSGPLTRRVLSPDAVSFMKNAFSEILPKDFDEADGNISTEEKIQND